MTRGGAVGFGVKDHRHECACGTAYSALLEDVTFERAVVYTPAPGDVVVLEVGRECTLAEFDQLKAVASRAFGEGVKAVVLGHPVRFAGVVREPVYEEGKE